MSTFLPSYHSFNLTYYTTVELFFYPSTLCLVKIRAPASAPWLHTHECLCLTVRLHPPRGYNPINFSRTKLIRSRIMYCKPAWKERKEGKAVDIQRTYLKCRPCKSAVLVKQSGIEVTVHIFHE